MHPVRCSICCLFQQSTQALSSGLWEAEAYGIKETVQTYKQVLSLTNLAIFSVELK